jgi:predicted metal-dependent phosphoesterase TrpH
MTLSRPGPRPGGRRVDLHTHTLFSDGALTPEALVHRAIERGLSALSITDHDALEALDPARESAGQMLEIVPGIELSCTHEGSELHLLGYFIDPADERLSARLVRFREERVERALAMVERLGRLGVPVDPDRVVELAGPGVIGRPHVAEALVQAGHVAHLDEAFKKYIGPNGKAFVPRPAFDVADAIALLHAVGGVSVLAHPGVGFEEGRLERLADLGLRGIEIWHPQHGPAAVRRLRALAARHSLIETGGSDFHGPHRGADVGELPVPASALQRLKDAAGVPG